MPSRLRLWIERYFLYHLLRLFRIRGQSERVARGFALGLVVNFFPTFGFGIVASPAVARLLGGNVVAGLAGGALLAFVWPALFYLNMKTGSIFIRPEIIIDDFDDVTEKAMDTLLWGKTFMVGAILNALLVGVSAYLLLLAIYHRMRPGALAYFRDHSAGHQQRFRRPESPPAPSAASNPKPAEPSRP